MLSWLEAEEPPTGVQAEAPIPSPPENPEALVAAAADQAGAATPERRGRGGAASPSGEPLGTSTAQDGEEHDAGDRQRRVPPDEGGCPSTSGQDPAKRERACSLWLCFAQRRDTTSAAPTR